MPLIPLSFEGVESFDNLPLAKYQGSIDKVELRSATEAGKFDQLQVTYLVTDGELLGRKSSEFLSMSPKAAFRLKRWFDKFGLADDMTGIDVDDETNLMTDPDLVGVDVIFRVYQDPKLYQGEVQVRTELVEVLDEPAPAPARTPQPVQATTVRRAAAAPEPEPEPDEAPPVAEATAAIASATPRRFSPRPAAVGQARRQLR